MRQFMKALPSIHVLHRKTIHARSALAFPVGEGGPALPVDEVFPCQSLKAKRLQKGDLSMPGIVSE